jgi:hypothetical protein
MANRPQFYIPVDFVEAMGWASVAREHLSLALEVLAGSLTRLVGDPPLSPGPRGHEERVAYLCQLSADRPVRLNWGAEARSLGRNAKRLDEAYHDAASSIFYSRGAGNLEWHMRELAERTGVYRDSPGMTPRKIHQVAEEYRTAARHACELAERMLKAIEETPPASSEEAP